ncbi:MAG: type II secretion system F family protein [Deltaproteobacteria bacterium]|nr:type II secretion system F family protein [Deltaproteobacteria bacterium]
MPQFSYVAVNKVGERVKGTVDAPNEGEVRVVLRAQGLRPVRINKPGALDFDLGSLTAGSVSDDDVLLFTRQLSILISSGIPLVQGLEIIAGQIESIGMKRIVLSIKEKISGGTFLWEAMKPYSDAFPDIYISMVRAGEASGASTRSRSRSSASSSSASCSSSSSRSSRIC